MAPSSTAARKLNDKIIYSKAPLEIVNTNEGNTAFRLKLPSEKVMSSNISTRTARKRRRHRQKIALVRMIDVVA